MKTTWKRLSAILLAAVLLTSVLLVPVGAAVAEDTSRSESTLLEDAGEDEVMQDTDEAEAGDQTTASQPEEDETEPSVDKEDSGTEQEDAQPVEEERLEEAEEGVEDATYQPLSDESQTPPVIPGYTRVTSGDPDMEQYYLIVTRSTDGTVYALYASEAGKSVSPGALSGADGACTAVLSMENGSVTAEHLNPEGDGALSMDQLHFEVFSDGNGYAFQSNGLYLMLNTGMFADQESYLSVSHTDGDFLIRSGGRTLSFNKNGDAVSMYPQHITDFWGPGSKSDQYKIYLYSCDSAAVEAAPYRTELEALVAAASKLLEDDYLSGWDRFTSAVVEAEGVLGSGNSSVSELKYALSQLKAAQNDLVAKPSPEGPPEGAVIIDGRGEPESGTTVGQPFASGTAGSDNFRIPALITLQDGTLVAASDARWNHAGDACALDTILSVSSDNGATWRYSFPNYFNDSTDAKHAQATAFIDPLMISGKDDAIYLMVDLFPGGIALNTAPKPPQAATGYVELDGVPRMVIYASTDNQTDDNYLYYVGDFTTEGYAPILEVQNGSESGYFVDGHYNLYYGAAKDKIYCPQLGSDAWVQQNVFYYNADLHVRNATYLWLLKSTDGGRSWSDPQILNPQVRPAEGRTHQFYGVGPGAGLCLDDGTIMLPCYTFRNNAGGANSEQIASFVYSTDGGQTWTRSEDSTPDSASHWSSESALVQIDENTVRHFYRDGKATLFYTDHTRSGGVWTAGDPVDTGVPKTWNNQLSAIRYSQLIDGKPAILVSTAASGSNSRTNGKLYTFLLNEDKTMTLGYTFSVTEGKYAYSSLTELKDGSIGLLYENNDATILYENFPIEQVASGAELNGKRTVNVPLYGTFTSTVSRVPTAEELGMLNSAIVSVSVNGNTITYTGLKEGTTSYVSDGVTTVITVAPEQMTKISLKINESRKIEIDSDALSKAPDPAIVSAEISVHDASKTEDGILGNTADENGFTKNTIPLTKALYRFEAVEGASNQYTASAQAADGTTVYLNFKDWVPSADESAVITIEQLSQTNEFALKCDGNYLYFFRNNSNAYYLVDNSGSYWDGCSFQLYRPVESGESSSGDLPGFVKINALNEIESGKLYLIAMHYGLDDYFFVNPALGGNADYPHVLRLSPIITHTLTLTGKSVGTTDLLVDGIVYRVTVSRSSSGGGSSSGGSSSGGSSSGSSKPSDNNTTQSGQVVTTSPAASVSGSKATVVITETSGQEIVKLAAQNGSSEVVVKPRISGSIDEVEVVLPAAMVKSLGSQTASSVKIDTPVVQLALPNRAVKSLSGGQVTLTAHRQGQSFELSVRSGGAAATDISGGITAVIPAKDCGPGTVAVRVLNSGERQVIRKSVADPASETVIVPLTGSVRLELVENSKSFADVPAGNWAVNAVAFASSHELFNGVSENAFAPNNSMTRGMLAVVLHNLEQNPAVSSGSRFPDAGGSWYTDAVSWAVEKGIASGYPDGTFAPNAAVTREQLVVMLWRYAGSPTVHSGSVNRFADSDAISSFAVNAMNWAVSEGILSGSNGNLNPGGEATRAQVAQMLMNYLNASV